MRLFCSRAKAKIDLRFPLFGFLLSLSFSRCHSGDRIVCGLKNLNCNLLRLLLRYFSVFGS
jgi:hypothetical protein